MPSHQRIQKRIVAVRNTQQITRAMKMVAASKFRKAQEAVLAARPFAKEMAAVLARLCRVHEDWVRHPLMVKRDPVVREDLFVLTADRGLCGSFNTNVLRWTEHYLLDNHERRANIFLSTLGKKGYKYFTRQKAVLRQNVESLLDRPAYGRVVELADELADRYIRGETDKVTLVFNEYLSAIQQRVVHRVLLPLEPPQGGEAAEDFIDYFYEPDKEQLLDRIVHRYLANQIFEVVLESVASEHGARMTSMENATENAGDMILQLTMEFNKARQNTITKELMEIVSGAEALKG